MLAVMHAPKDIKHKRNRKVHVVYKSSLQLNFLNHTNETIAINSNTPKKTRHA
jgi:hypothetical protein